MGRFPADYNVIAAADVADADAFLVHDASANEIKNIDRSSLAEALGLGKYLEVGLAGEPTWVDPVAVDWADVVANDYGWMTIAYASSPLTNNNSVFLGHGGSDPLIEVFTWSGGAGISIGGQTFVVGSDGSVGGIVPNTGDAFLWNGSKWVAGGGTRVLRYDFAFDTPNLNTGVNVWTPAAGDVLLDAWVDQVAAGEPGWNGTTPMCDIGTFVGGGVTGLFAGWKGVLPLADLGGAYHDVGGGLSDSYTGFIPNDYMASVVSYNAGGDDIHGFPLIFRSTDPLKLVVSQNGVKGGLAAGSTAGQASLYLVVATPTALN